MLRIVDTEQWGVKEMMHLGEPSWCIKEENNSSAGTMEGVFLILIASFPQAQTAKVHLFTLLSMLVLR